MEYKKILYLALILTALTAIGTAQDSDNPFGDYNIDTGYSDTVQEKVVTGNTTYDTEDADIDSIEEDGDQYLVEIDTSEQDETLNDEEAETYTRQIHEADVIESQEDDSGNNGNNGNGGNTNIEEITVQEYDLQNSYYFDFDNVEAEELDNGNVQVDAEISSNDLTELIIASPGQFDGDIVDDFNENYVINGSHAENTGDLQSLNSEVRGNLEDNIDTETGEIVESDANAQFRNSDNHDLSFEIEPDENERFSLQLGSNTGNIEGLGDSITLNTCGASGTTGPSQNDCDDDYDFDVNVVGDGIQEWEVPATGNYELEALGAEGDGNDGKGAQMEGTVFLEEGDVLRILVGQEGTTDDPNSAGGGGGTYITKIDGEGDEMFDNEYVSPLIIAGGGGGNVDTDPENSDATTNEDGRDGEGTDCGGSGGTNGDGGEICDGARGGGGAGYSGDGEDDGSRAAGGKSFLNGGEGGAGSEHDGGFGGGAGGSASDYSGGGGGGGYSGGGGSYGDDDDSATGGGAGSYMTSDATDTSETDGTNSGDGEVTITSSEGDNFLQFDKASFNPDTVEEESSDLKIDITSQGVSADQIDSFEADIEEDGSNIATDEELEFEEEGEENDFEQIDQTWIAEDVITGEKGSGYTIDATIQTEDGETFEQTIPIAQIREGSDDWEQLATADYGTSFEEVRIVTADNPSDVEFGFENTYHGETFFSGESASEDGDEYSYTHDETITLEDNGDWDLTADVDEEDFDGSFLHDTWGELEVDMDQPSEDIVVRQNDTFEMSGTLECVDGVCATSEDPDNTDEPETVEVWADPLETGQPVNLGSLKGKIADETVNFDTNLPSWYVERSDYSEEDFENEGEENWFSTTLTRFWGAVPW